MRYIFVKIISPGESKKDPKLVRFCEISREIPGRGIRYADCQELEL